MVGLYYALGGGLGHGMRALALARELARTMGGQHVLLVNSPFAGTLRAAVDRVEIALRTLPPTASAAESGAWVLGQRDELQPDLLVVDTFPRGLGGELAEWLPGWSAGLKVLVSRVLPESYVRQFQLASFSRDTFDMVFAPGEPSWWNANEPVVTRTSPWLVRHADELLAPEDAAQRLGCERHERCVLVVGSGTLDECREWIDWFRDLLSRWPAAGPPLRLALPNEIANLEGLPAGVIVRHVPLVELLTGAAAVVGNAGYHLVQETRWLGAPGRFLARRRLYDEQGGRLRDDERAASLAELATRLLHEFGRPAVPPPLPQSRMISGTIAAVQAISCRLKEILPRQGR
jgi:hypothetical protein